MRARRPLDANNTGSVVFRFAFSSFPAVHYFFSPILRVTQLIRLHPHRCIHVKTAQNRKKHIFVFFMYCRVDLNLLLRRNRDIDRPSAVSISKGDCFDCLVAFRTRMQYSIHSKPITGAAYVQVVYHVFVHCGV